MTGGLPVKIEGGKFKGRKNRTWVKRGKRGIDLKKKKRKTGTLGNGR